MTKRVLGIGALFLLLAACSSTTTTNSAGSAGGASGADVDRCKSSCDKMKFFDCSSAAEQAKCYDDCSKATSNQIEVFTGCAENSICDPECRTTITPKPAEGTPAPTGGGGATASTCTSACAKLVECSFIKVGDKAACEAQCQKDAYQYQIDCVNKQACSAMEKACGGTGSSSSSGGSSEETEIASCQSACDQGSFFGCFTASQQSSCRNACTTKPKTTRNNFTACQNSAGGECTRSGACLTEFQK